MNIRLVSDFRDYYDHAFDTKGKSFFRLSWQGQPKRKQFEWMKKNGIPVVPYGTIEDFYMSGHLKGDSRISYDRESPNFVVYTDEQKHCGEGKTRTCLNTAMQKFPPHTLCSLWIPTSDTGDRTVSISIRHLQIGNIAITLEYHNPDGWMSNVGSLVDIKITETWTKPINLYVGYPYQPPMFAIDFIRSIENGEMFAIDLNEAPGMNCIPGIQKVLPASNIVNLLREVV